MPTNCDCEDIVVDNCPPYLSVEEFKNYADKLCSNCSAIDSSGDVTPISSTDYLSALGLDSCCPVLTVYRGNQVIYSFDGGTTWIETGTAMSALVSTLGSINFVTDTIITPNLTIANTVANLNERNNVYLAGNHMVIREPGSYFIVSDLKFIHTNASNLRMLYEGLVSDAVITPYRYGSHMFFNGANPSEAGASRIVRLGFLKRFVGFNTRLRYRAIPSGTTFTSAATSITTWILKLGN